MQDDAISCATPFQTTHTTVYGKAQLPPHKEMNQRDTDHLRLQSTHAQNTLFISHKIKLFVFLQQPAYL